MCRPSGQIKRPMKQVREGGVRFHNIATPLLYPLLSLPHVRCFVGLGRRSRSAQYACFGQLWNIKVDRRQSTSEIELHNITAPIPSHVGELSRFPPFLRGSGAGVSILVLTHKPTRLVVSNRATNLRKSKLDVFSFSLYCFANSQCSLCRKGDLLYKQT